MQQEEEDEELKMIKCEKCCGILLERTQLNAITPTPSLTKSTPTPTPTVAAVSPATTVVTVTPPTRTPPLAAASITMTAMATRKPATAAATTTGTPPPSQPPPPPSTTTAAAAAAAAASTPARAIGAATTTTIVNSCRCCHCQHEICTNQNASSALQTQSSSHNDLLNAPPASVAATVDTAVDDCNECDGAMDGRISNATVPTVVTQQRQQQQQQKQPQQRHQTLIKTNLKTISSADDNAIIIVNDEKTTTTTATTGTTTATTGTTTATTATATKKKKMKSGSSSSSRRSRSSSKNECDIFQETTEMHGGKEEKDDDDYNGGGGSEVARVVARTTSDGCEQLPQTTTSIGAATTACSSNIRWCSDSSRKSPAYEASPARNCRRRIGVIPLPDGRRRWALGGSTRPPPVHGSRMAQCTALLLSFLCSLLTHSRQRRHRRKSTFAQHTFRIYLILQLASAMSLQFVLCSDGHDGQVAAAASAVGDGGGGGGLLQRQQLAPRLNDTETSTLLQGLSLALGMSLSTAAVTTPTVASSSQLAQLSPAAALGVASGVVGAHNIIDLISRDAVLKRHNNSTAIGIGAVSAAAVMGGAMPIDIDKLKGGVGNGGGVCQSCQMREKAKIDNLESIKMQILMRLQLSELPNITAPIAVPHNIIENFYKKYNMTQGQRGESPHYHRSYQAGDSRSRSGNSGGGGGGRIPLNRKTATPVGGAANGAGVAGGSNLYYLNPFPPERAEDETIVAYSDEGTAYGDDAGGRAAGGGPAKDEGGADDDADMQSDDPYFYRERYGDSSAAGIAAAAHNGLFSDYNDDGDFDDNGEDDEYFSRVNSVYVFPTTPHMRHNHKPEVLNFKFENQHSTIVRAFVHIYVRGLDWMRDYDASLLEQKAPNGTMAKRQEIAIAVHRAVRRPNAVNFTHTIKLTESRHKIPPGLGQWVQIEVKQLAAHWMENRDATQSLVMKGVEPWMRPFIVTNGGPQNKPLTVHIEVVTREKRRRKRSTSLDCQESDQEVRCCRYPLKVNFTNFGWHFVVAPTSFDAFFCNGECKVGYLEQYTHTHIASLTTSATPCCSPTKMSSLSLLYFNLDQTLVLSTIPNMSVDKCSCS